MRRNICNSANNKILRALFFFDVDAKKIEINNSSHKMRPFDFKLE